jgi:hypothetical protein
MDGNEYPKSDWGAFTYRAKSNFQDKFAGSLKGPMSSEEINAKASKSMGIIRDLARKAMEDTMKAIDGPINLAADEGGPAGVFAVATQIAQMAVMGASIALTAMRAGSKGESIKKALEPTSKGKRADKDDLLFLCLSMYADGAREERDVEDGGKNKIAHAIKLFEQLRGYKPPLPKEWLDEAAK